MINISTRPRVPRTGKRFPLALQTPRRGVSQGCKGCAPAEALALVGLATSHWRQALPLGFGTPGHAGVSPRAYAHMAAVFTNMTPELLQAVMKEAANATSHAPGWPRSPTLGTNSKALVPTQALRDVQSRWFCSQTVLKYHCHRESIFHHKLKITTIN